MNTSVDSACLKPPVKASPAAFMNKLQSCLENFLHKQAKLMKDSMRRKSNKPQLSEPMQKIFSEIRAEIGKMAAANEPQEIPIEIDNP